MRKRRFKRPAIISSKWADEAVCITAKIIKIELQNQQYNGKSKTVFYIDHGGEPEGRMCVIWGRTTFAVGDEILNATGRIKDGVFLIWSYLYRKATENEI